MGKGFINVGVTVMAGTVRRVHTHVRWVYIHVRRVHTHVRRVHTHIGECVGSCLLTGFRGKGRFHTM